MSQGSMTQVLLTLINLLTAGYHKGWKTSEFPKLPINSKQKGFGTLCTEVRIPASIFWLQQIHRIKLPPGVAQLLLLKHITAIKNKTKQQFLPATWTLQQKPLLFKQPVAEEKERWNSAIRSCHAYTDGYSCKYTILLAQGQLKLWWHLSASSLIENSPCF